MEKEGKLFEPAEDLGQFGNPMFRFTVLYATVIFLFTLIPLWLSFIAPGFVAYVNTGFILLFSLIWITIGVTAVMNFNLLLKVPAPQLNALKVCKERRFIHTVVVPCYIDPIEVLFDCLGSLLLQQELDNLLVVVAFEVKTPELQQKVDAIRHAFGNRFGHLLITIHTVDKMREIAGGCSNKNYALRQAHKYLKDANLLAANSVTLTTCDTDSLFHPNYFKVLETVYNDKNPRLNEVPSMCVWQPPLFYNWDLDQRPFFNRITGLMRSMMMLGGLITFNLNPMSIFSYPLELGLKAGFINPRYGVDDIIAKVRWMCCTNEQVPVLLLPVPVISGPTIGVTFANEVEEWSRQIRRWIVGSSESFHYFVIHWKREPLFSGFSWIFMFFMYYAVLLCSAGLFSLLAGIPFPWVDYPSFKITDSFSFSLSQIGLFALIIQYAVFAIAFYIDKRAIAMMTIKEDISIFRNIAHWLLAPPTLLVYSIIAFYAIVKFVFVGKKMARHDMAAKDGLASVTANAAGGTGTASANPLHETDKQEAIESVPTGNILNDEYEQAKMKPSRSRSTSRTSSAGAISDDLRKAGHNELVTKNRIDENTLLCKLPESFSFGEYTVQTSQITYRSNRSSV